ncbi:uncharacterized protein BO72DRAFT_490637 [Aspergillus fijiensis CBS 313.89]|uniref:Uncharacterized protein n=1 Tax=Aspergillus fijiensis CBS 313.89 TaxID=1448319 RepID=A0A8G1VSS4_9EURO|nr:uncharacterized protein BO72DRAFT_490637 [Aspergillus fijiensis CBS 313.89]RAK71327.1 hypothetical protein BO72DRAFT_490637 [Aspergillus fijiensis CBS 313.89]
MPGRRMLGTAGNNRQLRNRDLLFTEKFVADPSYFGYEDLDKKPEKAVAIVPYHGLKVHPKAPRRGNRIRGGVSITRYVVLLSPGPYLYPLVRDISIGCQLYMYWAGRIEVYADYSLMAIGQWPPGLGSASWSGVGEPKGIYRQLLWSIVGMNPCEELRFYPNIDPYELGLDSAWRLSNAWTLEVRAGARDGK